MIDRELALGTRGWRATLVGAALAAAGGFALAGTPDAGRPEVDVQRIMDEAVAASDPEMRARAMHVAMVCSMSDIGPQIRNRFGEPPRDRATDQEVRSAVRRLARVCGWVDTDTPMRKVGQMPGAMGPVYRRLAASRGQTGEATHQAMGLALPQPDRYPAHVWLWLEHQVKLNPQVLSHLALSERAALHVLAFERLVPDAEFRSMTRLYQCISVEVCDRALDRLTAERPEAIAFIDALADQIRRQDWSTVMSMVGGEKAASPAD